MGTSLTGLTPSTTYDALIKVGDNGSLSATAKVLSDGLGNDSVLALSTTAVGIGTATPGATLDVSGTLSSLINFRNGATNFVTIGSAGGNNSWRIWNAANSSTLDLFGTGTILNQTRIALCVNDISTERLVVGSSTATTIKGSGATSATTSLLVQNSAGTQIIKSTDNGVTQIGAYDNSAVGLSLPLQVTSTGSNNAGIALYANGSGNAGFDFYRNASFKFNVGVDSGNNFSWYNAGFGGYSFVIQGDSTGRITFGGNVGNASAQVSVDSTTRGFLPPRMTTTQRNAIASPAEGLMIYNTTTAKLNVYTTAWEAITSI